MNVEIINEAKSRSAEISNSILNWGEKNLRSFPWRKNPDPYRILIAEILLKRTTATAVNRIYNEFIGLYPDLKALAKANIDELEDFLQTIGYHKQRSKILKKISRVILNEYNAEIPSDFDSLIAIPNIGPYTAGAVLSLGYGIRAAMVDSNVLRIYKRVFFKSLPNKAVNNVINKVAKIILPQKRHAKFNLALLDLGGLICTYRNTHCLKCPIRNFCDSSSIKK
ncbi:MAG: hypothetical protein GF308_00890 [Candidatus Heimdallarchaeota archaeon]|nr:hypothetical protein [Candidatus Heimdallarchaeota archaeon]